MKSIQFGLLQSSHIHSDVDKKTVLRSIKSKNINAELIEIDAENLNEKVLRQCTLLINPLGAYYPEKGWEHILRYYENGGIILCIGIKPFTVPYTVKGGVPEVFPETSEAIHSVYVIDEYQLTGSAGLSTHSARVMNPRYDFLNLFINNQSLPEMRETCSIFYHLAEKASRDDSMPMARVFEENLPDSQAETGLAFFDRDGRMTAAPITRIDHFTKGSFVFLNFSPAKENYYSTDEGTGFLAAIIQNALIPAAAITVRPEYPRFGEYETVNADLGFSLLRPQAVVKDEELKFSVSIERLHDDEKKCIDQIEFAGFELNNGAFHIKKEIPGLKEGEYIITASLLYNGTVAAQYRSGFLKLSDKAVQKKINKFKPIKVDHRISSDFCVQDGKPFAMHGTTYFVTDKFRNFLFDFNTARCDSDLKRIRSMGFNILRTGNWHNVIRLFDEKGNIQEYSLRALEALFLTALKYDLPVQFVFAAYIFNPWDRNKCPVHNPEMREKTIKAASCFARRFKGWANVMVDAVNEPSYSLWGLWQNARPSRDAYELKNYRQWLKEKYDNDISRLRVNWNSGSNQIRSFEEIQMPENHFFERGYDTKPQKYAGYAQLADFYMFARDSYSSWAEDLRNAVKSEDPEMLFMMGRDEPLRIPAQQVEAYRKNYDMINWHQWHADSVIFAEYALNRVRGLPCCGQELGVYYYSDQRNNPRFDAAEYADMLERKLCYSFGNWIQWQSVCDPYMVTNVEIFLGLIRYDGTETKHMDRVRLLSWIEEKTAHLMTGRNDDAVRILTVLPSFQWFSCDSSLAKRAVYRSITAIHYHLNMQSDYVMEDLLLDDNTMQTGKPDMMIIPGFLMLSESAWTYLADYMYAGGTVLFSGDADINEYWIRKNRLSDLGVNARSVRINTVERINIKDASCCVSFRECVSMMHPGTVLNRTIFQDNSNDSPVVIPVGKGKMIYSPLPLELCDSIEPLAELYQYALDEAGIENGLCKVQEIVPQSNLMIYPVEYSGHVLYTIVNEGGDDTARFTDLLSGSGIELEIPAQRGAKLWIGKNGSFLAACISGRLKAGDTVIEPNGDLALYDNGSGYDLFFGERKAQFAVINGKRTEYV